MQKTIAFQYTNNQLSKKKEIRKTILFSTATERKINT